MRIWLPLTTIHFKRKWPALDKPSRRQDFEVGNQIYEYDIYKLDIDQP